MSGQDFRTWEEKVELTSSSFSKAYKKQYFFNGEDGTVDSCNSILETVAIDSLLTSLVTDETLKTYCMDNDFYFYGSGYQSWGYGGELAPGEHLKKYVALIPQWKQYYTFPGKWPKKVCGKKSDATSLLRGEFIMYFRWNNLYLAVCSTGRTVEERILPPVQFFVDRTGRRIAITVASDGKKWSRDELAAEITVFAAGSFFELKDSIRQIFGGVESGRFDYLRFLSSEKDRIVCSGWESWYNHYSYINSKIIGEDLESLGKTENLIKTWCMDKSKPTVFQVDDGWEVGCGQWDCWQERFPQGMKALSESITVKGYIPGLWVAPLIIDWRCEFAKAHRDWILRDRKGKPVMAGFNDLWGGKIGKDQPGLPGSYYCFDLSNDDVVAYLDSLMDKVVNEWGFRYIKLDFLFAGMIKGNFKNGGASYQWYDRAVKVLTKRKKNNKGENVAYLGCGLPFEPSYQYFPLSRIGSDTKEAWDFSPLDKMHFVSRPGVLLNMQSTLGHSFWDQSVYINDPDVVFLRYKNMKLNDKEKEMVAVANYLFASQLMHSDDPSDFDQAEGKFTQHILGLYEKLNGEDFGLVNIAADRYVIFTRMQKYVGIINLSEKDFDLSQTELFANLPYAADVSLKLEPVIQHGGFMNELFTSERHSISLYEFK